MDAEDAPAWLQGALGEPHATAAAQGLTPTGPAGGIHADEIFTHHRSRATVFLPCDGAPRPLGRVARARSPPPNSRS